MAEGGQGWDQDVTIEHDGPPKSAENESTTGGEEIFNSEGSEDTNTARQEALENQAEQLMKNSEFGKAVEVFSELFNLPGSNKLEVSLQIAECELCSKNDKLDESIQRVRESIPKSLSADDLVKMAEKLKESGQYVRALCLFCVAGELFSKLQLSPNDAASWISTTVYEIDDTLTAMFKKSDNEDSNVNVIKLVLESDSVKKIRDIATEYGVKNMKRLLRDLQALQDIGDDVRAVEEVRCYSNICDVMIHSGQYESAIRFGEEGLARLERNLAKRAIKTVFHGVLLYNTGLGYYRLDRYYDAERCYVRALQAYEKANYENEDLKRVFLKEGKDWLKIVRDRIDQTDPSPTFVRWFRRLFK